MFEGPFLLLSLNFSNLLFEAFLFLPKFNHYLVAMASQLVFLLVIYGSIFEAIAMLYMHPNSKALNLPDWAVSKNSTDYIFELERDKAALVAIDASGQQMDLAMYGDSITAWNKPVNLTKLAGSRDVWTQHFGDLIAEPLGIPGDKLPTLVWRLAVLGERPKINPKVVIIFIGINDVIHKTPDIEGKMEFLLQWLRYEMPNSLLVLQALLPGMSSAIPVNRIYQGLAGKYGITYSTCMQDVRKNDRTYFVDLLHPNRTGQDKLLSCLRALIQPLLEKINQSTEGAPTPP